MPMDFSKDRWDDIRGNAERFWAGELDRPLIHLTMGGSDPGRAEPALPSYHFTSRYDLSVPAASIVDRWDYNLSCTRFLGDAFPSIWPNFGPGVGAAFLGAELHADDHTTWFRPAEDREIADLKFEASSDNVWLQRVRDLCAAAVERWDGLVQMSMTDLGGNLDLLSTFRPSEKLLLDLYDHPEEVKRLTWEAHEAWWTYFEELNEVLQPTNPGYTAWTPIYSAEPYYMLQCDFCYMIGPDMFDEFVKPELAATCKRLTNPFYHLDGVGQLPHLDSLLSIPELKGVQWVPGDGQPRFDEWPDVYRKIRDAGKLIQIWGPIDAFEKVAGSLGSAKGIVSILGMDAAQEAEAHEFLARHGAE